MKHAINGKRVTSLLLFMLLFIEGHSVVFSQDRVVDIEQVIRQSPVVGYKDSVIRVMGDYSYTPFTFINEQGQPEGFDVDIIRAIAGVMDIKIDLTLGPWIEILDSLKSGRADALIGMYQTVEREKSFDFSIPHFISSYAVFVRKGSGIETLADISYKHILVQEGDLGHDFLRENNIGRSIISYRDWDEVLRKLSAGKGECAIVSRLQGTYLIRDEQLENIETIGPPILQRRYCIGVLKGNYSLLALLNEGLSIIKANGTYDTIYDKWFGVYERENFSWQDIFIYIFWIGGPLLFITILSIVWTYSLKRQVDSKTLKLSEELKRRVEIESQLKESEQELWQQNIRYEVVNDRLISQNRHIQEINKALELAKTKAEENDRLKTAFLANMSHEIRTPMHGIIGFTDLMLSDVKESQRIKYANIISENAQRLLVLLNDIIDVSRIETNQIEINKAPVVIKEMMQRWRDFYEPLAREKGLTFRFYPDSKASQVSLLSDETRLGQVLNNLLSNALKHTHSGSISMGYSYSENIVKIWVKDTGPGISSELHEAIFQRFVQGTGTSKNGTGLGLAIAKSLVLLMGGEIGLTSKPGRGSTFWFTHPVHGRDE